MIELSNSLLGNIAGLFTALSGTRCTACKVGPNRKERGLLNARKILITIPIPITITITITRNERFKVEWGTILVAS